MASESKDDKKFNMVAEEGNKRKGGMDKAEIKQCILGPFW